MKSAPGSKVKKSGTVEKVEGGVVHVKVKDKYGVKRHQIKMGDLVKEEVDQIDELNKDTVYSYNKKADADTEKKHKSLGQLMRKGDAAGANKAAHQINRRLAGMERAEKRLNKEEVELDEAEAVKKVKWSENGDPSRNSAAKTDPPKKQRLKNRVCSEARNVPACSRNLERVVMKVRFILRVREQKQDRAMKPMRDLKSCGMGARK